MNLPSPIATVASSLLHAALVSLPDIQYQRRDHMAMRGWSSDQRMDAMRNDTVPVKDDVRRPAEEECRVHAMFQQTFGSTALGFGGVGGAAMTPTYTVVIEGPGGQYAVYWNGRFAYLVDPQTQTTEERKAFREDLSNHWTASAMEAVVRYGSLPSKSDV